MQNEYKKYTELDVWKESRKLAFDVYSITQLFPSEERFGLSQQLRRCAVSIPSNIAEGIGRNSPKDTIKFLYISRGSLFELETQLYLATDFSYITNEVLSKSLEQIATCRKLLSGLINYYQKLQAKSDN